VSEREPPASTENLAPPGETTNTADTDTNAEDFKPFPRKRFWRDRPDSSRAPQEPKRPPDEPTSEQ
jgi:hypothetical protein